MWKWVASIILIIACTVLVAAPVVAQMQCRPRVLIAAELERMYAEVPVAMGLMNTGGLIEVFASSSGSWTMVLTTPRMMSCVVAAGEAWSEVSRPNQSSKLDSPHP